MRGGSLGHVQVFVIGVRYVLCLFVGAGSVACVVSLFAVFDGLCCYSLRLVMYAWRLTSSCLGVCDRRSLCNLLVCLVPVVLFVFGLFC